MKKFIDKDEWYPVYYLAHNYGFEYEVPDDLIKEYDEANDAFEKMQEKLEALYIKAKAAK